MYENNREDILSGKLEYIFLSLIAEKIKVSVIGGGRAGFIKANSFAKKGCLVSVVSKTFIDEFEEINNLKLIEESYDVKHIKDKHIVVIATDNNEINEKIKEDCENMAKIYIYCPDFKQGNAIMPISKSTKNIYFALNTKGGNPRASIFLSDIIKNNLESYDEWVGYINSLREKFKGNKRKDEIMQFVSTEDFKFFYDKNFHEKILNMFYGGNDFEINFSNKKK